MTDAKKEFTADDRLKAIDIADVDMYLFNQTSKLTEKVMASERFMVITSKGGKRYVFRELIDIKPDSGIIAPKGPGLIV